MSIKTEGVSPLRQKLRACHRLALDCRLRALRLEQLGAERRSCIPRHIRKREKRCRCTQEQLRRDLNRLRELIPETERLLGGLPPKERVLMRAYYVEGLLWREVEPVVGYRKSHVDRIHRRAMGRLEHRQEEKQAQKTAAEQINSAAVES